ncbi:hypothetical protein [Streptomyces noursei]|uniref:hypothetical protein n=1 Tax=Streptomyces noursei TaxID=1971 RepID=UPI00381677B6
MISVRLGGLAAAALVVVAGTVAGAADAQADDCDTSITCGYYPAAAGVKVLAPEQAQDVSRLPCDSLGQVCALPNTATNGLVDNGLGVLDKAGLVTKY